ncbi:MAG: CDP-alcohol phosphatidyltransferase family protein [Coriobacteriales bacterium]|nr:CDP-alcohol phosphatidyltransferase family protein [Coriobacteriales bacterium]
MSERTERAKSTIKGVVAPDAAASQEQGTATAPLGTSENPSNAVVTLANFITLCRFILTVIFLVLFVQKNEATRIPALALYAIAACTDFLDGQVARRTQTVSWVGKIMDPLMDRFLLFTGVLGLVATGELPIWVACFVIGRDLYLGGAAMVLRRYRTRPLDVIYVGKVATALLMSGFVLLLIAQPVVPALGLINVSWLPGLNHESAPLGIFFVYVGLICSTIAMVTYTVQGFRIRSEVLRARAEGREVA